MIETSTRIRYGEPVFETAPQRVQLSWGTFTSFPADSPRGFSLNIRPIAESGEKLGALNLNLSLTDAAQLYLFLGQKLREQPSAPDPRSVRDGPLRQKQADQTRHSGAPFELLILPEPILTPRGKRWAPLRAGEARVWAAIAAAAALFILLNLGV